MWESVELLDPSGEGVMRIIKLSADPRVEDDFRTPAMVDTYFLGI